MNDTDWQLAYKAGWMGALVAVSQEMARLALDVAEQHPESLPALLELATRLSGFIGGLAVPKLFNGEPIAKTRGEG